MPPPPLEICSFTEDKLYRSISCDYCPPDEVSTSVVARYLYGYLKGLKAACILIEREYVDGDYLEDFASYYVSCFES